MIQGINIVIEFITAILFIRLTGNCKVKGGAISTIILTVCFGEIIVFRKALKIFKLMYYGNINIFPVAFSLLML